MDKLLDSIETLHKAVNNLAAIGVLNAEEVKDLSEKGLDKIINKEQILMRNDALSYFAELDNQNK